MNTKIIPYIFILFLILPSGGQGSEFFDILKKTPAKLSSVTASVPSASGVRSVPTPFAFVLERLDDDLFLLCETTEGVVNVFRDLGNNRVEFFQFKRLIERDSYRAVAVITNGKQFAIAQKEKILIPKIDPKGVRTAKRYLKKAEFRAVTDKTWVKYIKGEWPLEIVAQGNDGLQYAKISPGNALAAEARDRNKDAWTVSDERSFSVPGSSADAKSRFMFTWTEAKAINVAFVALRVWLSETPYWFGDESWNISEQSIESVIELVGTNQKFVAQVKMRMQ